MRTIRRTAGRQLVCTGLWTWAWEDGEGFRFVVQSSAIDCNQVQVDAWIDIYLGILGEKESEQKLVRLGAIRCDLLRSGANRRRYFAVDSHSGLAWFGAVCCGGHLIEHCKVEREATPTLPGGLSRYIVTTLVNIGDFCVFRRYNGRYRPSADPLHFE
jgi:hypothetical protein